MVNITWVTLIPKIPGARRIDELWPISMMGSLYRIVSKLLYVRLKYVVGDLINESKTTFISYKQIVDGVFIAN